MRPPTGMLLRLALLLCAGLVGLVVVAGCSDDPPDAGRLPTGTPSATSSSPTPDTPEDEVEAAVRAYYAELTRAAQTNDTSKLRTLTTKGCPCYRAVRVINRGARRGEITPDAVWTIGSLRVHDVEARTALAEVRYRVSAYDVINEAEVVGRVQAQRSHFDLSLVRGPDRWIVGNLFDLEG